MLRALFAVSAVAAATSLAPAISRAAPPNSPRPATLPPQSSETLHWGSCPADSTAPGLHCARLKVPLDYRRPNGRKITIAVSRLVSPDPAKRRGVLFLNSGGPGGEGLKYPAQFAAAGSNKLALPKSVRDRYDIIGFDPRGVGHSTPVTCDLTPAQRASNIPPYARSAADVARQAKVAKQIAKQCGASRTAQLLPYMTTANTARDMDQIRAALGVKKISYEGVSYGTYLGAVYTTLFPRHSDRIVLDSAMSPDGWDVAFQRRLARGFQDRFPDFANYAAAHPEYGLGSTPAQVTATYFQLAARLDAAPNPNGITGAQFRQATFAELYYDIKLPALAEIWHYLDTGQPLPPPPADPTQSSPNAGNDNAPASFLAVTCDDSRWPTSIQTYQRHVALDRVRYPMFGAAAANISPCAYWPVHHVQPKVRIGDRGSSDVLIAQNRRDPVTTLVGARMLRRSFGDRARMVTADQGGHLAYLFLKNRCLNDTVTRFLATGKRPRHDLACPAEPPPNANSTADKRSLAVITNAG